MARGFFRTVRLQHFSIVRHRGGVDPRTRNEKDFALLYMRTAYNDNSTVRGKMELEKVAR